ncbi:hypothetical protein P43SY_011557 [Pythium insidiosum]|uniref:Phytanoyl-CoA dioxygenase family protein n=1 Tax=Pythium insidiosum TaxID=114742 RepID=A0AAD5Q4U9_PYTIN|nr:hypothetical protein P43SY_011557 [Pythium insidiosum]
MTTASAKRPHADADADADACSATALRAKRTKTETENDAAVSTLSRDGYVVVPDTLTQDELRVLRYESEQLFRSLDDDPEIAAARVLEQVQLGATRFPASYRRICVTSAVCLRRAASST